MSNEDDRLTKPEYWAEIHKSHPLSERTKKDPSYFGKLARRASNSLVQQEGYASYHFWNVMTRLIRPGFHSRCLEIGAAPGTELIKMNKFFGVIPYGVEYTAPGTLQVRKALDSIGFPPEHVFECDAFSEEFQSAHAGEFDIVISLGLIEHFDNVEKIIAHHTHLLKPGGTLVIRIPRLRGVNYLLTRAIDPPALQLHNLSIMSLYPFQSLFALPGFTANYCGYQGGIHLTLADEPRGRWQGKLTLAVARKVQALINVALFRLWGNTPPESAAFSPFLVYIGEKKGL